MTTIALPKRGENKYETDWSRWSRNLAKDGVIYGELDELLVRGFSGGMQVQVLAGTATMRGFYFHNPELLTIDVTAADANNPRIDLVVLRMDISAGAIEANQDPVQFKLLTGVPATEPVAPILMESDTVFDVILAEIYVSAGVVTISAEDVKDVRPFSTAEDLTINFFVPLTEIGKCPAMIMVPEDCEILSWHLVNAFGESGSCSLELLSSYDLIDSTSYGTISLTSATSADGVFGSSLLKKVMFVFVDVLIFDVIEITNLIMLCRKVL
jgi:hypothetical protein